MDESESQRELKQEEIESLLASQPHDGFFQLVFSRTERAVQLFQRHLPARTAAIIDWTTLRPEPASFIKTSLHRRQCDLLFSAQSSGGTRVYFHILFEHQTTVDPAMSLRLLTYMVEIWTRFTAEHPCEPLPVVVPFVLHQGPDRWTVSTQFSSRFALPESMEADLRRYLPDFTHVLLDLTLRDPATEEEGNPELQTILLLMKLAREQGKAVQFFSWLAPRSARLGDELLRLCLVYVLHGDSKVDLEEVAGILKDNPQLKENVMSTAMRLRAEGAAEGEARGAAKGLLMGKVLMLEKFLGLPASEMSDLDKLDVAALEARFRVLERQYDERFKK